MEDSPVRAKSYQFAVRTVRFCREVRDPTVRPLVSQLLRAGTSIGANVEEARAAQSRKDFIAKMSIASKEAREACYWLRLLRDSGVAKEQDTNDLLLAAGELTRILTAIVKTTRERDEP